MSVATTVTIGTSEETAPANTLGQTTADFPDLPYDCPEYITVVLPATPVDTGHYYVGWSYNNPDGSFTPLDWEPVGTGITGTTDGQGYEIDLLPGSYPNGVNLNFYIANTDASQNVTVPLLLQYNTDCQRTNSIDPPQLEAPTQLASVFEGVWQDAMSAFSPLVLDLSSGGTGLTLSANNGTGAVLWDFGDGFLHQSGFVTGNTGLLCIEPSSGPITQADLFGNEPNLGIANGVQYANGFQTLQAFAGMTGGELDASNPVFSELRVWVPSVDNSTVTTPGAGELYTLAQLGITSINLNYSNASYAINGNQIEETSTFVINGNTQTIADAWFSYDPLNNLYDGSVTLNPEAVGLPDQHGYGELPELIISMSTDSTLLSEVQNLAGQSFSQLMTPSFGLENAIKTILYEWAGVTSVDPTSQGSAVNAQNLAFDEQLMGQNLWNAADGTYYGLTTSSIGAVPWIDQTWDTALSYLSAHLLAQAGFNGLMGVSAYNAATDTLYDNNGNPDDVAIQFADEATSGTLSHLATNDIFVLFPGDATTSGFTISETPNVGTNILVLGVTPSGVTMYDDSHGNLWVKYTSSDLVEISASTASNGGSTASQYISEIAFEDGTVWNLTSGLHLTATTAFPAIYGSENGGDVLDGSQITGAHLYGYAGDETFIAGPGSSMVAGTGTNTYVINPGSCPSASSESATISPNTHATGDQIVLHSVTESQVIVSDNSAGTLFIDTSNGDEVIVNGGTNTGNGIVIGNVAGIDFDDGTVWNLQDGIHLTATSTNYIAYGTTTGGDTLDGSQITGARLHGYAGDETFIAGPSSMMWGGSGTNTFVINAGSCPSASSESATINLNTSATGDQIVLHGVTESQVQMYDNSRGRDSTLDAAIAGDAAALALIKARAASGEEYAQLELSTMYEKGLGVLKDKREQARWDAEFDDETEVAGISRRASNDVAAVIMLRAIAEAGDKYAESSLGQIYRSGPVIDRNQNEAVKWTLMAANRGYAPAQMTAGNLYATDNRPFNPHKAPRLSLAPRPPETDNHTTPDDRIQAYKWYSIAMRNTGNVIYVSNLRDAVTRKMTPTEISAAEHLVAEWRPIDATLAAKTVNLAEQVRKIEERAKNGDAKSEFVLGQLAERTGNSAAAFKWYLIAASKGHLQAEYRVSEMYSRGDGVNQNSVESFFWKGVADRAQGRPYYIGMSLTLKQEEEARKRIEVWKPDVVHEKQ